ncbi:acetyl-CoA hydrolase/transferase family protein [Nocardioides sp. NPDC101246]|uniref:acetyl-CoA hydrolase/transferase family protein n=1 Tax=Nocardioides sp. NPDC101246 TaxID=3364336 RepID=UPI00380C6397
MRDLAELLRAGDTVVWGQGCAEPRTLTHALREAASAVPDLRCFVGISAAEDTVGAAGLGFKSYGGGGVNRLLDDAGRLDIVPSRYSDLPQLIAEGAMPVDVALVQVTPGATAGTYHLALAAEYLMAAVRNARVVVAEVNHAAPHSPDAPMIPAERISALVEVAYLPTPLPGGPRTTGTAAIGAHVAGIVSDGATLQVGIGALPDAAVRSLSGHHDLGVHTGALGDALADLIAAGVVTNAHKTRDTGVSVAGLLLGSEALFRLAHRNPAIALRETAHTHDPAVLASLPRFTAINAAIEIDLTGQVNTEVAGGRYVGAAGGALDFARPAMLSPGGGAITIVRATAGGRSAIVPQLHGPVAVPRSEVDWVVTEYGAARLRGLTLAQRRERLIGLAHPDHRAALEAASPGAGEARRADSQLQPEPGAD